MQNVGQTLAWLGAAAFFGWKLAVGYSLINLSLEVTTKRAPSSTHGLDSVLICIKLQKGDRASLSVDEIAIDVTPAPPRGEARIVIDEAGAARSPLGRRLRLTPGESTQFERLIEVASERAYRLEVTVEGEAARHGYWRASAVSAPIVDGPAPAV